jgi:hypothetical protein
LGAAERRLRRERDALPLFAAQIARSQPLATELVARSDQAMAAWWAELRAAAARSWRRSRARLRLLPEEERRAVLRLWNEGGQPATHEYLADLLTQWERGWRGEHRTLPPRFVR